MKDTNVHKMLKPLVEDVEASLAMTPDTPFRRRTIYRTSFAAIEGHIEHIGYASYHFGESVQTPPEKIYKLKGKRITDKGNLTNLSFKQRTDTNLKELINTLAPEISLNKNTKGWCSLLEASEVRDSLMHPKKVQDLEVSDRALDQLSDGWNWFMKTLCEITDEALKK